MVDRMTAGGGPDGQAKVRVELGTRSYDILIGPGRLAEAGAQIAARQLNLRSVPSLVATGATASFLCGASLIFLSGLFAASAPPDWYWRPDLLARTAVTALLTPLGLGVVHALTARLADEDAGPRTQRLARSGRVA